MLSGLSWVLSPPKRYPVSPLSVLLTWLQICLIGSPLLLFSAYLGHLAWLTLGNYDRLPTQGLAITQTYRPSPWTTAGVGATRSGGPTGSGAGARGTLVMVQYRYWVDGQEYEAWESPYFTRDISIPQHELDRGAEVTVYYEPGTPERSSLIEPVSLFSLLLTILATLLLLCITLLAFLRWMVRLKFYRDQSRFRLDQFPSQNQPLRP